MHMTHRMMNVGLMTSNDDIESSSSTTTRKKQSETKKIQTAGILNEKLTIFFFDQVFSLINDVNNNNSLFCLFSWEQY